MIRVDRARATCLSARMCRTCARAAPAADVFVHATAAAVAAFLPSLPMRLDNAAGRNDGHGMPQGNIVEEAGRMRKSRMSGRSLSLSITHPFQSSITPAPSRTPPPSPPLTYPSLDFWLWLARCWPEWNSCSRSVFFPFSLSFPIRSQAAAAPPPERQ